MPISRFRWKYILYTLFVVFLLADMAGFYIYFRTSKTNPFPAYQPRNNKQTVTKTPTTATSSGEVSLLMNNFDKAYTFHPLDPQKLPPAYYENNKSLYGFLYSNGNIPIPFPKFNQ